MANENMMMVFNSARYNEKKGELRLKTASMKVSVDERKKKLNADGSKPDGVIWSTTLGKHFEAMTPDVEWLEKGKGVARAGVACAVFLRQDNPEGPVATILNRFNKTHPSKPNFLTPASGVHDSDLSLAAAARNELGEEVIPTNFDVVKNEIFAWMYAGEYLAYQWVVDYAKAKKLYFHKNPDDGVTNDYPIITDLPMEGVKGALKIYVDGIYQGMALVACEKETGSLEFIFLYLADVCIAKGMLRDGERDMYNNGEYLDRDVDVFTLKDLQQELKKGLMTTKALAVVDFMTANMATLSNLLS